MLKEQQSFIAPTLARGGNCTEPNRRAVLKAVIDCGGFVDVADLERNKLWGESSAIKRHLIALSSDQKESPLTATHAGGAIRSFQLKPSYSLHMNGKPARKKGRAATPKKITTNGSSPKGIDTSDPKLISLYQLPEFAKLAIRVEAVEKRLAEIGLQPKNVPAQTRDRPAPETYAGIPFAPDIIDFNEIELADGVEEAVVIVDGRNIENQKWFYTLDERERFLFTGMKGGDILVPTQKTLEFPAPYYRILSFVEKGNQTLFRLQGPSGPFDIVCTKYYPLAFDRIQWERLVEICTSLGGAKYAIAKFNYLTNFPNHFYRAKVQEQSIKNARTVGVQVIYDNSPREEKIGDVDGHVNGDICLLPDAWLLLKQRKKLPIPKRLHVIVFCGDGVIARQIANKRYLFKELHGVELVVHVISWKNHLCHRARAGYIIDQTASSVHSIEDFENLIPKPRFKKA